MSTLAFSVAALLVAFFGEELPLPKVEISPEHAARLYRVETYNAFRLDRAEFERRRELGDQVWSSFDKAGRSAEHRQAVVDWFTAAREATIHDELPALPVLPLGEQIVDSDHGTLNVVTSAQEDKLELDLIPAEAVQSFRVELPPGAVQTGPSRFFSSLVKTTLRAAALTFDEDLEEALSEPEAESTEPTLELTPPATTPIETTPITTQTPVAPPTAAPLAPPSPAAPPAVDLDIEALFAPAESPVTPPAPAVSEDPFGVK
jgi:hypothetical protein